MKKVLLMMIALLCLPLGGLGGWAWAWDGSGTKGDPWQIKTIADLNTLATNVNAGMSYSGEYFQLVNNLDYSGVSLTDGCNYTPIGWGDNTDGKAFSGIFDGNGKTISGITYNKPTAWGVGVFGYISKASIKDLTVENCTFIANGFVGGICGCSDKVNSELNPTIDNCHVASSVTLGATDFAVGGIIGINDDNLTIKDCTSAVAITSTDVGIGGIIGVAYEDVYMATITDSYYLGNLPAIGENGGHKEEMGNYATINITLLNDDSEASVKNTTRISNYTGMTAKVTLSGRTLFKDDKWNTLCLPFDVATLTGTPLEGATLKDLDIAGWYDGDKVRYGEKADGRKQTGFDDTDGTLYLYFKDASTITAGKPYLIKWTSGSDISGPVFSNVTISNADSNDPEVKAISNDKAVYFVGTYSQVNYPTANPNHFFLGAENYLYYPAAGASIGAMRAYFVFDPDAPEPGPSGIKQFVLNFGEEETGISDLTPSPSPKGEGSWYDLSGRKVANGEKPKANGLYIVNGKKVIIK